MSGNSLCNSSSWSSNFKQPYPLHPPPHPPKIIIRRIINYFFFKTVWTMNTLHQQSYNFLDNVVDHGTILLRCQLLSYIYNNNLSTFNSSVLCFQQTVLSCCSNSLIQLAISNTTSYNMQQKFFYLPPTVMWLLTKCYWFPTAALRLPTTVCDFQQQLCDFQQQQLWDFPTHHVYITSHNWHILQVVLDFCTRLLLPLLKDY